MVLQGVIGDELINKQPLVICNAVSHQRHQMPVMHAANDLNLGLELPLPLPTPHLQLLHRHRLPVGEIPLVHTPEPAFSDHVLGRKPVGYPRQLLVGEPGFGAANADGFLSAGVEAITSPSLAPIAV